MWFAGILPLKEESRKLKRDPANLTALLPGAGDIRTDMFFELVSRGCGAADISILNPNVFYELGRWDKPDSSLLEREQAAVVNSAFAADAVRSYDAAQRRHLDSYKC